MSNFIFAVVLGNMLNYDKRYSKVSHVRHFGTISEGLNYQLK